MGIVPSPVREHPRMAKNLKKFVNPEFLNTIDLTLMRRLLERHEMRLVH
jgi:hypothetical protein